MNTYMLHYKEYDLENNLIEEGFMVVVCESIDKAYKCKTVSYKADGGYTVFKASELKLVS